MREKIAQGPVPRGLCYFKNNYLNLPHVIDRVYCELTQLQLVFSMKKVGGKLLGFVFGVGILFALLPEKQAGAQDLLINI